MRYSGTLKLEYEYEINSEKELDDEDLLDIAIRKFNLQEATASLGEVYEE